MSICIVLTRFRFAEARDLFWGPLDVDVEYWRSLLFSDDRHPLDCRVEGISFQNGNLQVGRSHLDVSTVPVGFGRGHQGGSHQTVVRIDTRALCRFSQFLLVIR